MSQSISIKRMSLTILKWFSVLIAFSYTTSFLVKLFMAKYSIPSVENSLGLDYEFATSMGYTIIFMITNVITGKWVLNRFSAFSWKNVWIFGLVQTGSGILAFIIGTIYSALLFIGIAKNHETHDNPYFLLFVFIMCLVVSLLFNSFYYVAYLYRNLLLQQKQAAEHELAALKSQINPHFLFNSLNSIASLIRINPQKAEEVTEDLAELFRYSLKAGKEHVTTLQNEIESVGTYFRIEKARFSERIHLKLVIPSNLSQVKIPSLILQPLVENSVKHAAGKMIDYCEITVQVEKKSEGVMISVSDNGPGFPALSKQELLAKGTGLTNVNQRLWFAFGAQAELHFQKNSVSFIIPYP